jgi:hypothetical protein
MPRLAAFSIDMARSCSDASYGVFSIARLVTPTIFRRVGLPLAAIIPINWAL